MENFDKQKYSSLLVQGNLHEAINYLEKFSEKTDLVRKYKAVFVKNDILSRSTNKVINDLDQIYQKYYKDIFWHKENHELAEQKLFKHLWDFCGGYENHVKNSEIEIEVEKIIRSQGYEFLGGDTAGYYGPYIWKSSSKETYDVELPSSTEKYSLIMMDGFVSRSWLDFLSFGEIGTGGWIGKDGSLCCIKSLYDVNSQDFKTSFLKHEAQHGYDIKMFPGISSVDLEYRAKLVELIYWEDYKIIKKIHLVAKNDDEKNTHSWASHRIISDISRSIFEVDYEHDFSRFCLDLEEIREVARNLLNEDTIRLSQQGKKA